MALVYAGYYFYTGQAKKLIMGGVLLFILVFMALGISHIASRLDSKAMAHQVEGKSEMAKAGVEMFMTAPVLGLGYKGYYENFGNYFPSAYRQKYDAHNEYVTALANYGIVGFIPFIMIFVYPLLWARKRLKKSKKDLLQPGRLQILVGMLSVMTFAINQFYAGSIFYQEKVVFLLYANIVLMFSAQLKKNKEV